MAGIRPFQPGEYINNPDGTYSTERTVTIQDGSGKWVNVPSLWKDANGKTIDLGEDEDKINQALGLYERQGKPFQRFETVDDAVSFAKKRSSEGGAFSGSALPQPNATRGANNMFNIMDLFGPQAVNRLLQPAANTQGVQNMLMTRPDVQPAPVVAGVDPWQGMREEDVVRVDPMQTASAAQPVPQSQQKALSGLGGLFSPDKKAVLNDFFIGLAQGANPTQSLAMGALNIRNRNSQRQGLNQTVSWLKSKGVDETQARVLAEEAQMGNKAPLNEALKNLTQGADPMRALELEKAQLEIENLRNPRAKTEDTALIRELKAAGLKEGTPEFQEAILANNRPKGMMIESDGQGGFKMVQGTDVSGGANMNVEQGKNTGFLLRAQDADKVITSLEKEGTSVWNNTAGQIPLVGNFLRGDDAQKFDQAKRDFINAQLRQESGAVISPEEFKNAEVQYFPQPGDDDAVIEQKRRNRENAIKGFRIRSGPGAQSVDKMDDSTADPLGIR